jgi:uncharacterized membrane protein
VKPGDLVKIRQEDFPNVSVWSGNGHTNDYQLGETTLSDLFMVLSYQRERKVLMLLTKYGVGYVYEGYLRLVPP